MDVLARLALAQAARLARRGAYRSAEALLGEAALAASGPRADVLDMRARMCAQQGRRAEAEALWREALPLDPGNADIRAALAALARPGGGRTHLLGLAARSLAVVVLLLLAWTVLAQRRELGRLGNEPAGSPAAAAGAQAAASPSGAPAPGIEAPQATGADIALLDSLAAALTPLGALEVVLRDGEVEVRFREALFSEGAALRSGAPALMARIAASLTPLEGYFRVVVVGHADAVPLRAGSSYPSNLALGLARATRVAGILLESGAFPAEHVAVQSLGAASPPYPDGTSQDGRRNRTVTLRFAPAG